MTKASDYLVIPWGWAGHAARMGESRRAYSVVLGKPEGERPLGRPGCRWEDSIKTDIEEMIWVAWTGLFWRRIGASGGLS
jgi:hypothetical protein